MKPGILKQGLVTLSLAATLAPCGAFAQLVYIDSFDTTAMPTATSFRTTQLVQFQSDPVGSLPLTETLFGTRRVFSSALPDSGINRRIELDLIGGEYNHSTQTGARGRTVLLLDGKTGTADNIDSPAYLTDPTKKFDLTAGGINDIFQIKFDFYDFKPRVDLFFMDTSGLKVEYNVPSALLPTEVNDLTGDYLLNIPLSAWAGIDFTNIVAFQMNVDSAPEVFGMDVVIDYVGTTNTVPEPSTLMLLGAGLAGLVVVRRRAKK